MSVGLAARLRALEERISALETCGGTLEGDRADQLLQALKSLSLRVEHLEQAALCLEERAPPTLPSAPGARQGPGVCYNCDVSLSCT